MLVLEAVSSPSDSTTMILRPASLLSFSSQARYTASYRDVLPPGRSRLSDFCIRSMSSVKSCTRITSEWNSITVTMSLPGRTMCLQKAEAVATSWESLSATEPLVSMSSAMVRGRSRDWLRLLKYLISWRAPFS